MSQKSKFIEGVKIKNLNPISDERGMLMELVRKDDDMFVKFGQTYMTSAYPGVVKGWHYHKVQFDNFSCVQGMIKLVLFDSRESSKTKGKINEFFLGIRNPICVQIPPLVWHGFKCVSEEEAIVINVPSEPYNHKGPDEYRKPYNDPSIPYEWERKNL